MSFFKRNYLSNQALTNLKNYKYVSGEYSIMDHVLTPFWNASVKLLPMWLAPNVVTLIGTIGLILQVFMYLPYDMALEKDFSPICYYITAFSFFFYQTLDAIDGK